MPFKTALTIWQSIGLFSFLSLVLGTAFTLASCGILIYLWRGADLAHDRKEPQFWKTIATSGWAARVATICSAVIRTSIAVQVGVIAAALSAIILETTGVRFNDVTILSSERASKSGFINIFPAVLRQTTGNPLSILYSFITILGLTIMAVSTFISTILLSDFTTAKVASPGVTTRPSPPNTLPIGASTTRALRIGDLSHLPNGASQTIESENLSTVIPAMFIVPCCRFRM